jgi:hypothetical protein
MKAVNLKLVRGIFATLVVGALGFGATQALASPTRPAFDGCTEQQEQACVDSCKRSWGPLATGSCVPFGEEYYLCECGMGVEW